MTSAEARFNNSLRPRKPECSLGRTAQDGHLDTHTAPELCEVRSLRFSFKGGKRCRKSALKVLWYRGQTGAVRVVPLSALSEASRHDVAYCTYTL